MDASARDSALAKLNAELLSAARSVPRVELAKRLRYVGLLGLQKVVLRTPVLTGFTRAQWQTTDSSPATSTIEATDPGGADTISRESNVIERIAAEVASGAKPPPLMLISNPAPNALVLEEGGYPKNPKRGTYMRARKTRGGRTIGAHYEIRSAGGFSKQAPRGMVAITLEELRTTARPK